MARQAPWSVKGVDEDARQIARDAAEAADMPIGAWIDRAILTATGATEPVMEAAPPPPAAPPLPPARIEPPAPPPPPPPPSRPTADETPTAGMPAAPATPDPAPPPEAEPETETEPAAQPAAAAQTRHAEEDGGRREPRLGDVVGGISRPERHDGVPRAETARPMPPPRDRRSGGGLLMRRVFAAAFALAMIGGGVWVYRWIDAPPPPPGTAARAPDAAKPGAPAEPGKPSDAVDETARRLDAVRDAARANDPKAQYDLGVLHARGEGVPRNEKTAAEWFERAALRGFAPAQFNLGVAYEQGRGVERKPEMAFFWYQSAAEQNYAAAQYNLGVLYAQGQGTPRNYERARGWFEKAIAGGAAQAHYSLGLLYENGFGVARDPARAAEHYRKAAAAGVANADERLKSLAPTGSTTPAPASAATQPAAPPPMETPAPVPSKALARSGIAEVQRLLRQLNFEPGAADGIAGDRTIQAIRLYQQFAGLAVDGKPTQALLQDLRQVVGAMESPAPR